MARVLRTVIWNLRNVLNFSGRESRADFWPFAVALYLFHVLVTMAIMIPRLVEMMARMMTFALTHPKEFGTPGQPPRLPPDIMSAFSGMMVPTLVINSVLALLLAAAITRRLHDRDRTGFWGLLPLPPMALGVANMDTAFSLAGGNFALSPAQLWLYLAGLLFWPAIILLLVFLAKEGTNGANRFGPKPLPRD